MIASFWPEQPLPGDPNGQRLCELFGNYLWQPIQAPMPKDATEKPKWHTLTAHPMRPRVLWSQWQDAEQLVGVRFGHTTRYGLIDIDAGSIHHSADAIAQLRAALETIGLTRTLLVRSSWSGGLHLYIPLPEAVNTFNLAVALKECCKAQGFPVKGGQLEIFPNVKSYGVSIFVEYNAHRLPLQPGSGSCLLDDAFQAVTDDLSRFLWVWDGAAAGQDMTLLQEAMVAGRNAHRKRPKRQKLTSVEAWRGDLEAEIEGGWTDHGQTNGLLKSIACYGRVFERLEGQALINYILRIAASRPGYEQYCGHQSEMRRRAISWASAAEKYYWPLGSQPQQVREVKVGPNQNELRAQEAQSRIRAAFEQLKAQGQLPGTVRERITALVERAQTSVQTLYKYLCLWHPEHEVLPGCVTAEPIEHTADQKVEKPLPVVAPKLSKTEVLHTPKKMMKCKTPSGGDGSSEFTSNSSKEGVRGRDSCFPQLPLLPLEEIQTAIQQQIQQLGWSGQEISSFIAQRFDGRRWSQLLEDEWVLLLYHLRVTGLEA